jgi:hypothetical protein
MREQRPKRETHHPDTATPDAGEVEALVRGEHGDPFAFLGPHVLPEGAGVVIRAFLPGPNRSPCCLGTRACPNSRWSVPILMGCSRR